jgi:hypothetical protein
MQKINTVRFNEIEACAFTETVERTEHKLEAGL